MVVDSCQVCIPRTLLHGNAQGLLDPTGSALLAVVSFLNVW